MAHVAILTPDAQAEVTAAYRRLRTEGLPMGRAAWLVSRYEPYCPALWPAWFLMKRRHQIVDLCADAESQLTEEV